MPVTYELSYMTLLLIAQWIEQLPSVREVMGSISVGDLGVFFVPCWCQVDQFTFHLVRNCDLGQHFQDIHWSQFFTIQIPKPSNNIIYRVQNYW